MAQLPLISNFESDFVLQLVVVEETDDMDAVAATCAHHSLNRRVKPQPGRTLRVRIQDAEQPIARDTTVTEAGFKPMETIEIYYED